MTWRTPLLVLLVFASLTICGQSDTISRNGPEIKLSGFLDVFYVYDFNRPSGASRQPFLFNHNRHNEFNLNLGFVKLAVDHRKYRANITLQTGTYAIDNYAAEPGLLQNIFEANVGVSLNQSNTIWLDAGVLPSHIGFESAISVDNFTLTRSLLAENSPYFLTGAKLTAKPGAKWEIAALVLNGWQRIQRLEGNSLLSFGTQLNYSPSEKVTINWSTFIGTDDPDSTRRMRYFNNFYGRFQVSDKFKCYAGFDIGFQESRTESGYDVWLSPVFIGQYTFSEILKAAVRLEYYQDEEGVIITTLTGNQFNTTGISMNIDYAPAPNILCRLEARRMSNPRETFERGDGFSTQNFIIAGSIAVKISEVLKK
jgi:hypothetical protein